MAINTIHTIPCVAIRLNLKEEEEMKRILSPLQFEWIGKRPQGRVFVVIAQITGKPPQVKYVGMAWCIKMGWIPPISFQEWKRIQEDKQLGKAA